MDNKAIMRLQIFMLVGSLSLSFVLTYFLGIWGIVPAIGIFLMMSYMIRRKIMQGQFGGFGGFGGGQNSSVTWYCIGCGAKHKLSQCPQCGSRMRRAGFS